MTLIMSRGIHLKQLTTTDLSLLGLPHSDTEPTQDAEPTTAPPEASGPERDRVMEPASRPHAGPPGNPNPGRDHQATPLPHPGPDDPPDLAELTREIRRGLEDTLRLLEPAPEGGQL